MIEIKFQGRGGQGVVVASEILARACFEENMYPQCFSIFGGERRGAPVSAFMRISNDKIHLKCDIDIPDHLVLFDETLIQQSEIQRCVTQNGSVLINSYNEVLDGALNQLKVGRVDALEISQRNTLGTIINTAMLGAYVRLSPIVKIDTLLRVVEEIVPGSKEKNVQAAQDAYETVVLSK